MCVAVVQSLLQRLTGPERTAMPDLPICFKSRLITESRTRRLLDFTCFLADGGEVGSHVSVSAVGQLRQLLPGGAARHQPQLLLQDVCALGRAGNPDLPSGNNQHLRNIG